ncbi:hypothetical protein CY34DRAFT_812010 [Suillus luteus UH-Slu-Lm8-n1]|uniref:Uncharacterized protein n=1 Tax=Suillus luteus UH-Slu-Lm8-n1 TaxID=930992 RepID=A0A0C9ZDM4_9AGAM|nr:hypothetical protein CY34DRAFT_812010 [Suillus luteus UH-Slu-Lm8-n1]
MPSPSTTGAKFHSLVTFAAFPPKPTFPLTTPDAVTYLLDIDVSNLNRISPMYGGWYRP